MVSKKVKNKDTCPKCGQALVKGFCKDCLLKDLAKADAEVEKARKLRESIEQEGYINSSSTCSELADIFIAVIAAIITSAFLISVS